DKGGKTPGPDGGGKTPGPDKGKTPGPDGGGKTPGPDKGGKTPGPDGGGKPDQTGLNPERATLTVQLPADATLFVDDYRTRTPSGTRSFVTPLLPPGRRFEYTLRAERTVDGVTQTMTRAVTVQAGHNTAVTFDFLQGDVARK